MKKKALFLTLGLLISIVSCGGNSSSEINSEDQNSSEVSSSLVSSESSEITAFKKFQEEKNLIINIQNASGLGIVRKKENGSRNKKRNSGEKIEITNVLVKSTVEYNQNDIIYEDGNVEVSFLKTITTNTTSTVTKEKTLIAYIEENEKIETNISVYGDNYVSFESDDDHLYRLVENGVVVKDWTQGIDGTTTFEDIIVSNNMVIENKSLNAKISYPSVEGATYTLYDESNNLIYNDFVITDDVNVSTNDEMIVLDGLTEGNKYILKYTSQVEEETVSQSNIGGEIDKLYVYNERFTFISFVPYGCSSRPNEEEMKYEDDGIAVYDKTDYYSSNDRISFIIDNNSGYIYKIEDINIAYIHNNLLVTNEFDYVYDFYIDENNDLKIYALYTNKDIEFYDFGKDIYGNKYVSNTKLNYYDEKTNTTYFVAFDSSALLKIYTKGECTNPDLVGDKMIDSYWEIVNSKNLDRNVSSIRNDVYLYTSNKRIVHTKAGAQGTPSYFSSFFYLLEENSSERNISPTDSFYVDPSNHGPNNESGLLIDNNHAYSINYGIRNYANLNSVENIVEYDLSNMEFNSYNDIYSHDKMACYKYFIKHKVILLYDIETGSVYLDKYFIDGTKEKLLEEVNISDDSKSILKYGVHGNEYYEIIVKENNGEIEAKAYLVGTYKEEPIIITIQPIKR